MKFFFRLTFFFFFFFFYFSHSFAFLGLKEKYHIGCLLPLNDEKQTIGRQVLKGLLLGLMVGKKDSDIILSIYNTQGDPVVVTHAIEEMANKDYKMAIALVGKRTALAAINKARELKFPLIVLSAETDLPLGEIIYRNFITPQIEVENLLDFIMGEFGFSTFAIFCPNDEYGKTFSKLFEDGVEKRGGIITAVVKYPPETTDFGPQIKALIGKEIAEAKPEDLLEKPPQFPFDAIFIPDVYLKSAFIISQFAYYNARDLIFLGTTLWAHPKFAGMIKGNCQAAYYPTGFTLQAKKPWVQEFIIKFRRVYNSFPEYLSAQGYDVGRIIDYLKNVSDLNLENAYEFVHDFPGVTGMTSFLPNGEVKKKIYIMEVTDGIVNLVF